MLLGMTQVLCVELASLGTFVYVYYLKSVDFLCYKQCHGESISACDSNSMCGAI